jgi:hypothetical protein
MPTVLQFRRGSAAQNAAFTGSVGEISINTDRDTIHVHDGSTAGGFELAQLTATQTMTNKTLTSPTINSGSVNNVTLSTSSATLTGGTINGMSVGASSASTGAFTTLTSSSTTTLSNTQVNSLGVGTAGSGTTGEIRATNQIVAYYSDERLKENIELISNPIEKIMQLRGVTYTPNQIAESYGYDRSQKHVGVIAQEVKEVLPEAVQPAPFDRMIIEGTEISRSGQNYMTVQYERIVPLLIEAIKEQQAQIEALKAKVGE